MKWVWRMIIGEPVTATSYGNAPLVVSDASLGGSPPGFCSGEEIYPPIRILMWTQFAFADVA